MYWVRACSLVAAALAAVASPLDKRDIEPGVYEDLDRYMKYASNAYSDECPSPLGNTLVATYSNTGGTFAYIARDDQRQELVVAFRGSDDWRDWLQTNFNALMVPLDTTTFCPSRDPQDCGMNDGIMVHAGFHDAYNSVANPIIARVRDQLARDAVGYNIVTTGHSLGGALSSLAAVSLQNNFPATPVLMYTYGQPRTGNDAYADYVSQRFGGNAYRVVHTTDPVPRLPPTLAGYAHHLTEYWMWRDPPSAQDTMVCQEINGDRNCLDDGIRNGRGIIIDQFNSHTTYFGRSWNHRFCN